MKSLYKVLIVIAVAIVAMAAVAVVYGQNDQPQPPGPEPTVPVEVDPDDSLPSYIRINMGSKTLVSSKNIVWSVHDDLVPYAADPGFYEVEGRELELEPGLYTVVVDEDAFQVTIDGTRTIELAWEYWFKGDLCPVSVTYDINMSELAGITKEFNKLNDRSGWHVFSNLPQLVHVNDTVFQIVEQMESEFERIGGDLNDEQSFADFLVSLAQLGIRYPTKMGGHSADYEIWGENEYWANTLQTLFFKVGDCDDSAAVICALFSAEGFKTAMCGVTGHVVAGVALNSFEERTDISEYNKKHSTVVPACATPCMDEEDNTLYYGCDGTLGQLPAGYLTQGTLKNIGSMTMYWGKSGFYPVTFDQGDDEGIH